jgi:hypothetical protein
MQHLVFKRGSDCYFALETKPWLYFYHLTKGLQNQLTPHIWGSAKMDHSRSGKPKYYVSLMKVSTKA